LVTAARELASQVLSNSLGVALRHQRVAFGSIQAEVAEHDRESTASGQRVSPQ